jgi:DNA-binding PadR family transcriptional regulator
MVDVLRHLLDADRPVWGLALSAATGRPTGTVYPLLVRLEEAAVVISTWEDANDRPGPRRRLYALTDLGRNWAAELCSQPSRTATVPRVAEA